MSNSLLKQFNFANMAIDSTALQCPNATEFFTKAYIADNVADNFRLLPNVKYQTEIATTLFGNLLQDQNCDWNGTGATLSSSLVTVCNKTAQSEICLKDVETSFLNMQMKPGSNLTFDLGSFMSFYYDIFAKKVQSEIALIRWQGNGATSTAVLKECDGYEKLLAAESGKVLVGATASLTTSNIIGEIDRVVAAVPAQIRWNPNLRLYVSNSIASLYLRAVSAGNTQAYLTKALDLTYLGIPLVIQEGMSASKMYCTLNENLIYAFDALQDSENIKSLNMSQTTLEPKLRTRADMKIGFTYVNAAEIVCYY